MRRLPLRSPPRMRGKDGVNDSAQAVTGITPACAGKSSELMQKSGTSGDHPRVCGEKKRLQPTITAQPGSPPRVRGKAQDLFHVDPVRGITPAYAGKRDLVISESGDIEDHPRVCGEKQSRQRCRMSRTGSPPRMRGKDGVNDSAQAVTGITPACAGKRRSIGRLSQPTRDHPRVCGEKLT